MSTRTDKNAEISRKWHFKLNHQKNNLQCGQSPGDLRSLVMFLLPKIPGCRRFHTTLQQMVWGHQMLLVPCIRRPTANSNQQPSRPSKFYRKGEKTQIDAKGCIWGNQHQVKIQGMKLLNRKIALNTCTMAINLGSIDLDGQKAPITSMTCNKSWSSLDHSNSKHPKKNK